MIGPRLQSRSYKLIHRTEVIVRTSCCSRCMVQNIVDHMREDAVVACPCCERFAHIMGPQVSKAGMVTETPHCLTYALAMDVRVAGFTSFNSAIAALLVGGEHELV